MLAASSSILVEDHEGLRARSNASEIESLGSELIDSLGSELIDSLGSELIDSLGSELIDSRCSELIDSLGSELRALGGLAVTRHAELM